MKDLGKASAQCGNNDARIAHIHRFFLWHQDEVNSCYPYKTREPHATSYITGGLKHDIVIYLLLPWGDYSYFLSRRMSTPVPVPPPFDVSIPLDQIPTPLVFLNPSLAHNINLATYIHIASTGVSLQWARKAHWFNWIGHLQILIWDVINNLRNDLRMIFNCRKLCITMLLYFVMRWKPFFHFM